ncbi:MAG: hypothetical protein HY381_01330 [Candidatus Chisholmbacteria bacterium]|nr:hypothetical protein [Candidatus Chisholmbacteria bacterium]
MGRLVLIIVSSLVTVGVLVGIDRGAEVLLNRWGYFMAMSPNLVLLYQASEFTTEVKISKQGLRNREVVIPKPAGVYRILALGDSFTFGWGVDEGKTWPRLVEAGLRERGLPVEVINAGVPGIGPFRERLICQAYADQFGVDAFIIGLTHDDFLQSLGRRDTAGLVNKIIDSLWPTVRRLWRREVGGQIGGSEMWREWVDAALKRQPELLLRLDPVVRNDFVAGRLHPYVVFEAQSHSQIFIDLTRADYVKGGLKELSDQLGRLKRECTGVKPVVVIFFPPAALVSENYFEALRQVGYEVKQELVKSNVDVPLKLVVERQGFDYVSPVAELRRDGCPGCYFAYDGHMTPEGQQRMARMISAQLVLELDEFLTGE